MAEQGEEVGRRDTLARYQVTILPDAFRQLDRLPTSVKKNVAARIEDLGRDRHPQQAKPLKGEKGLWRLRVGDYRVLYRIQDELRLVLVLEMGNRKDVYRGR